MFYRHGSPIVRFGLIKPIVSKPIRQALGKQARDDVAGGLARPPSRLQAPADLQAQKPGASESLSAHCGSRSGADSSGATPGSVGSVLVIQCFLRASLIQLIQVSRRSNQ